MSSRTTASLDLTIATPAPFRSHARNRRFAGFPGGVPVAATRQNSRRHQQFGAHRRALPQSLMFEAPVTGKPVSVQRKCEPKMRQFALRIVSVG